MTWIDTDSATPTEILVDSHYTARAITVYTGELAKGTVMGQYNTGAASGCFGAYDDTAADGRAVAQGILIDKVDATASGVLSAMYTHAQVYEEMITGLDTNAKTDLKGIVFIHKD